MSKEITPKTIVCAVRGQPVSRRTVTRAIDLALEHNARLIFMLVVAAEFMGQVTPAMVSLRAVYEQLWDLGEFTMLILCDRAERRGVEQVEWIIRKGDIREQIVDYVKEIHPDVLVLGLPLPDFSRSVFTPDEFDEFVRRIEKEVGIEVVQVRPAA
jgi:nucleotide-binding universal stress UspA family protein